jgi:translocation and assembly module TamB
LRLAARLLAAILAVPVLLVAGVLVLANTAPGQRLIEHLAGRLTGGTVMLSGLSGRVPDRLRLAHLEVRDAGGTWLAVDGLALDWAPLRLLDGEADIGSLSAARIDLARLPAAAPGPAAPSAPFRLPVRVDVAHLHVGRLALGAPVAGAAAVLEVDGHAAARTLQQGTADITARRLDGGGTYHLAGRLDATAIQAALAVTEPPRGLLADLAGLPDLGAIGATATLDGPRDAAALVLALRAGGLRAAAHGTLDLVGMAAALEVDASAPAMAPRPDVSWQDVALHAHVQGPFTRPDATGSLAIDGVRAAGVRVARLAAEVAGNQGAVRLRATATGTVLPGPRPDLLAAAPVTLQASVRLDQPDRPVTFALAHPLLQAHGTATTAPGIAVQASLDLPDLAPLAAIGGIDLAGHATLSLQAGLQDGRSRVAVDGRMGLAGGVAPVPALIGPAARLSLAATQLGSSITLEHVSLEGAGLDLQASGSDTGGRLEATWHAALADLAQVTPRLLGAVQAQGHVAGTVDDLAAQIDLAGDIGAPGVPRAPVRLSLRAAGLPAHPAGTLTGQGTLLGAPLALAASLARDPDGSLRAEISQADWKSAHAEGAATLPPGATLPFGRISLRMTRLADLAPLLGAAPRGSLTAEAALTTAQASLRLDLTQAGLGANGVARVTLTGTAAHPLDAPVVTASLAAEGIDAAGVTGSARLEANGPQTALGLRLSASLAGLAGAPAQASAAARLDLPARTLALTALQADWHGEALRLLAPARIAFAQGVALDRLRLAMESATLDLAGRVTPDLDLTVALRGVTPDLAAPFVPGLAAEGTLAAEAKLAGTLARPTGTLRLTAAGLRLRSGPGRALPPAGLTATADLAGTTARLDAQLAAGPATRLSLAGQVPLATAGALDLRATGGLDLAMLNPILAVQGRRVLGRVSLDAAIAGSPAHPAVSGTLALAGGEVQDFAQGVHLTDIAATLAAEGQTLRIRSATARAGGGSIALAGSLGALAPDLPVDLTVTMRHARPLVSDRLTATLSADLTLRGALATRLDAAGRLTIETASIRVPDSLPPSVAVLAIRRAGQPPPPAPSGPVIGLDVTVDSPGALFVRGHGLDAELAGRLHLGGTAAQPLTSGGFHLRQGTFAAAGTTLTFTKGEIGFNGARVIDPSIDFEASVTANNVVATLAVTGYASAPKLTLSSVPALPQDEVLSYLLFRRSTAQISPFQAVAIAQTLASFTGVGGGLADPLAGVRAGLGLDRLSVGGGTTGSDPTLEAGRYLAPGVYVGAKQGTSGADTQAQVQIDLYRGLKLETGVGTGRGGNSVGLTYQFQY